MLETLRMQEVSQIVLSMPEGAIIPGKECLVGEPIMIINNPSLSNLSFTSRPVRATDAQGHIGTAGITNQLDFIINEGSILYALWNYIYGIVDTESNKTIIKGNEYLTTDKRGYAFLGAKPILATGKHNFYLYKVEDNQNILLDNDKYEFCIMEDEEAQWLIHIFDATQDDKYFVTYDYEVEATTISTIKQIHNNIFAAMDIYIDAVDLKNDDKHTVIIHCDKVQIDTDVVISVNDSSKASFTPIQVKSVPGGEEFNKDVATIVVI